MSDERTAPASTPAPRGPAGQRRSRRRRRGGGRPAEGEARRPEEQRRDSRLPAPALPPKAVLDASKPAAAPLSAAEKAELKQHFAFIAKYRRDLRVRANDAENLLINGAREPEDRGVCLHLLGKIDRALVTATLARVPDAGRRTRILAGVVRFSRDVAVLIQYLECLGESASRGEAAATLIAALPELDYAAVSAAQMRRVLELIAVLLPEAERPMLVLSLLRSSTFLAAFDHASEALPEALASLFAPMRAVFAAAFAHAHEERPSAPDQLARGVRLLLAGPAVHLGHLPEETRARLVAAALELADPGEAIDRGAAALLGTLPKDGRRYSQLATQRVRQLLAAGGDAEAKVLLEELRQHHPDFKLPGRWLAALGSPRVGRVALLESPEGSSLMRRGLWLEHQRQAWVILGPPAEASQFAEAAVLHGELTLGGVLPLLTSGTAPDGAPYLAVVMHGEPMPRALGQLRHETGRLPDCLRSGVELIAGLALAGVTLPDADLRRFTLDREERLHLASLTGCRRVGVAAAGAESLATARALCEAVLHAVGGAAAWRALRGALEAPSLHAMARSLTLA
jgi:hypothetical protein